MFRVCLPVGLWIIFVAVAYAERGPSVDEYGAPDAGQVRIVRDTFGVPHVIARDHASLLFGVGFAQAEDQLENIARNYLMSEGRGGEVLGKDQLPLDHLVRAT